MLPSTEELARARRNAAALLEAIELDAYLFEVEPGGNVWQLRIDCAVSEGWQSISIRVERERLLKAGDDPAVRDQLLRDWLQRLCHCKRRGARR